MKKIVLGTTSPDISKREKLHHELAREAAREGIVLLKNEGLLPLKCKKLALYGSGARQTVAGGTGSGAMHPRHIVGIEEGLEAAGVTVLTKAWLDRYDAHYAAEYAAWKARIEEKIASFTDLYRILGVISHDRFVYPTGIPVENSDLTGETEKRRTARAWAATLSDWEWLLDVMQAARAGLGYTQGYPMSMYQPGYISTGNLVSSFGGSGVEWQTDETSENVVFGADGPAFKTYVETMNEWYANGWIDPNFQTNEELFWRSDENTVRQGYVGLYLGMNDQLFDGMDMGTPTTEGIYVEGMPYPINDKYGTPEQQYVKPYTFYCMQPEVNSVMVTTDAEKNGKDLAAMFTLLDACYTEEFSVMKARGLSKEMLEASQDGVKELYADVGYPEGTTVYNPDPDGGKGEYYMVEGTPLTTEQEYYTTCKRMFGLEAFVALREQMDEHQVREYLWNYFTPSEYLTKSFYGQLTPDQYDIYEDKLAELRNALAVDIPKFIRGDSSRPLSSWDSWYQSLKKTCQVDQITNMLNNVYHSLNG